MIAPTAASWTRRHQGPFQRHAWIPTALLGGPSWPRRPAQQLFVGLRRPATASSGAQDSIPEVPSQPAAEALPFSQQPDQWGQARQRVIAFQQQHGRLPRAYGNASCPMVPGERPLGLWCADQQRRKAGSKGPPLTTQEQAALAEVPGWAWWLSQQVRVSWEQRLQQVETFVRQHGRLPRQRGGSANPLLPGERELGRWLGTQRKRYKGQVQPQLLTKQVKALEAVPGWSWGLFVHQLWEEWYQQVEAFVRQHGRLPREVPSKSKPLLSGERELAQWCMTQRQRWKGNLRYGPSLPVEQQAALEALPGWWWEMMGLWEAQCRRVAAFVEEHGRLPQAGGSKGLPHLSDERKLGRWCDIQQQRWIGSSQSTLTAEQQAALAAIPGWVSSVPCGWEQLEGSVPGAGVVGSAEGGVSERRKAQPSAATSTSSHLEQQQEQSPWEQTRQQVVVFQQQYGRLPRAIPGNSLPLVPGERPLGLWCADQQRRKADSKGPPLTAQEQAALAEVPGWAWWLSQQVRVSWEQRLQQLVAFVGQQGRLPRQRGGSANPLLPGERELGAWVANQRSRYKGQVRPQLSTEQAAALEAVPGWSWGLFVQQPWEEWYQQVEAIVRQHGRLPRAQPSKSKPLLPGERELAQWCKIQRRRWQGKPRCGAPLPVEQEVALNALPGWFWEKSWP